MGHHCETHPHPQCRPVETTSCRRAPGDPRTHCVCTAAPPRQRLGPPARPDVAAFCPRCRIRRSWRRTPPAACRCPRSPRMPHSVAASSRRCRGASRPDHGRVAGERFRCCLCTESGVVSEKFVFPSWHTIFTHLVPQQCSAPFGPPSPCNRCRSPKTIAT